MKKAPGFSDAFVFDTSSYERTDVQYEEVFFRERLSLSLAVSLPGSEESHALLV